MSSPKLVSVTAEHVELLEAFEAFVTNENQSALRTLLKSVMCDSSALEPSALEVLALLKSASSE